MDLTMKLYGAEDVKKAFEQLPVAVSKRVLRYGLRQGLVHVRTAMRAAAPVRKEPGWKKMRTRGSWYRGPGFLKRKQTYKFLKRRSNANEMHYGVGPFGDAFYGYIVARGHVVGRRSRWKTMTGSAKYVPAHDYITPVWNANVQPVIQKIKDGFETGILKEGEKLGFKKSYGWYFG